MKKFLTDWNARRIFYLVGGIWMVAQSIIDKMWVLIPFGFYFIAMAVLKFGCASGSCNLPYQKEKENTD